MHLDAGQERGEQNKEHLVTHLSNNWAQPTVSHLTVE